MCGRYGKVDAGGEGYLGRGGPAQTSSSRHSGDLRERDYSMDPDGAHGYKLLDGPSNLVYYGCGVADHAWGDGRGLEQGQGETPPRELDTGPRKNEREKEREPENNKQRKNARKKVHHKRRPNEMITKVSSRAATCSPDVEAGEIAG
eukprot:1422804-Pyramimonas_sp.AAC.1